MVLRDLHHRMQWQLKSWWKREFDPIVSVLSDSNDPWFLSNDGQNMTIPNLYNTGCDSSYFAGLCCKNHWMLKYWKEDPKFKHVRWFYRGMDDSWVHLQNLVWLAQQYNHSKPVVIGERVCTWTNLDYPDGGPGFLISRAVLEHPQYLSAWSETLKERPNSGWDDFIWGAYVQKNNITFVHYHGFSHANIHANSSLYNYFLKQKDTPWPLSFRPVAYHQSGDSLEFMPTMDEKLHEIDYSIPHSDPYTPPNCRCLERAHKRCGYNITLSRGGCKVAQTELECLGPGPWPNQ